MEYPVGITYIVHQRFHSIKVFSVTCISGGEKDEEEKSEKERHKAEGTKPPRGILYLMCALLQHMCTFAAPHT